MKPFSDDERDDNLKLLLGMEWDASSRKSYYPDLRKMLVEKEALLKEMHHRVKNNFQILSSLLMLQADQLKNPELADILKDSVNRIFSMSVIHEHLYQSGQLSSVNLGTYLTDLAYNITSTLNRQDLILDVDCEDIELEIETCGHVGLIVNELVSNSLKHACTADQQKLQISITGKLDDHNEIVLRVADNGSNSIDTESFLTSDGLGLTIVQEMTDQLEGRLEIKSLPGLEFTIHFPYVNQ